jgi:uncharacterized protein YaaN involved in tellurite resistance
MEQEMMEGNEMSAATSLLERLSAAAGMLEQGMERMENRYSEMSGEVQRIVATVEGAENSLERRLGELERVVSELRSQGGRGLSANAAGMQNRKTLSANTMALLAKQGISASESVDAGALDAALNGLSIEQRIAVKSQLLRAGLLG